MDLTCVRISRLISSVDMMIYIYLNYLWISNRKIENSGKLIFVIYKIMDQIIRNIKNYIDGLCLYKGL